MRVQFFITGVFLAMALAPSTHADPLRITVTGIRPLLKSACYDCRIAPPQPVTYTSRELKRRARQREIRLKDASAMTPEATYALGWDIYNRPVTDRERDEGLDLGLIELAAARGHKPAQRALIGLYRYHTDGNKPDRYRNWLDRIAAEGTADDWVATAYDYEYAAAPLPGADLLNHTRALGWMTRAAEAGHPKAQIWLASRYSGTNDLRDIHLALHWATRAADGGDADAMMLIADVYMGQPAFKELYGRQTDLRDPLLAIRWYARAAASRAGAATEKLCLWPASDTRYVYADAMTHCLAVYDDGLPLSAAARIGLARALFDGDPLPQDYARAWMLLDGVHAPEALYYKARMKIEGLGTEAVPATGWAMMAKAARDDSAQAQAWLKAHPRPETLAAAGEYDVSRLPIDGVGPEPSAITGHADYYPERAIDDEIEGTALVRCQWIEGRPAACEMLEETPKGYRFGKASIRTLEKSMPSPPSEAWIQATTGKWSDFEIRWTF